MGKSIFIMSLVVISSLLQAAPKPATPKAPFGLRIAAESPSKTGPGLQIKVAFVNNSDHKLTVFFLWTAPACDFEVDLRDSHGSLVPQTSYMEDVCGREPKETQPTKAPKHGESTQIHVIAGESIADFLNPGQSREVDLPLGQLFKLNPGTYSVRVRRTIPDLWKTPVESNTITIISTK